MSRKSVIIPKNANSKCNAEDSQTPPILPTSITKSVKRKSHEGSLNEGNILDRTWMPDNENLDTTWMPENENLDRTWISENKNLDKTWMPEHEITIRSENRNVNLDRTWTPENGNVNLDRTWRPEIENGNLDRTWRPENVNLDNTESPVCPDEEHDNSDLKIRIKLPLESENENLDQTRSPANVNLDITWIPENEDVNKVKTLLPENKDSTQNLSPEKKSKVVKAKQTKMSTKNSTLNIRSYFNPPKKINTNGDIKASKENNQSVKSDSSREFAHDIEDVIEIDPNIEATTKKTYRYTVKKETIDKWKEKYPWIKEVEKNGEYMIKCQTCLDAKVINAMTSEKGVKPIMKNINVHVNGKIFSPNSHAAAEQVLNAKKSTVKINIAVNDEIPENEKRRILAQLRTKLKMTVLNISDTCLPGLSQLQAENGLNILSGGGWYTGHKMAAELDDILYEAFKEYIVKEKINDRKTFSASFDESDSVANEKILAVVLKCVFVKEEQVEVQVKRNYGVQNIKQKIKVGKAIPFPIALKEIKDGNADTVLESFEESLDDWSVPKPDLSSLGTDGAKVLTGRINGVVTQFRRKHNPSCICIHCVCHRLNLAGNDSTKKNVICTATTKTLKAMRAVFSRSSHRCNILKDHQIKCNEPTLQVGSFYAVRWGALRPLIKMMVACPLSIQGALREIQTSKSLTKKTSQKIQSILKFLSRFENRAMILVQQLVLDCTKKIFNAFESNELDFLTIQSSRDGAINYLESLCREESTMIDENIDEDDNIEVDVYNKFIDDVENDFDILDEEDEGEYEEDSLEELEKLDYEQPLIDFFDNEEPERRLQEFEESAEDSLKLNKRTVKFGTENVSVSKIQLKTYKAAKKDLIEDLVRNLKQRFPDNELQIVHSLSRILNPNRREVDRSDIDNLMEHFDENQVENEKAIDKELIILKQLKNQFSHVKSVKMFSGIIIANYADRIPKVAFWAEVYVDLMLASAEAERVFSDMNRVMTKLRNRMSVNRMSKKITMIRLHRILEKDEIEIILQRALSLFMAAKKRRKGVGKLV